MAGLRETYDGDLFQATIRDSIRVPEAAAAGVPVTAYVPDANVAADVRAVAEELVARDPDRKDSIEIAADQQAGWRGLVGRLVGSRS